MGSNLGGEILKRVIIGTAGHIDHGKTTLVKALTGIETDRLKEEKKRGISIELGFAPFLLPDGQRAAIVDVPGHERFIKQMLAGSSGIDLVLLTIAADEGVMPQTREHMDIINLLGVEKGIVVITKKDLVDEEWLFLIQEEIREYLADTILKDAPIIPVSAFTGEGMDELKQMMSDLAQNVVEKPVFGQARIPIDRVFTMPGFGTVITGTLWSGQIKVGDTLELMPGKRLVKVRTLQVHNQKVDTAYAGQRVAVNLQGIEVAQVDRGFVLASPGLLKPARRINTRFTLLKSARRPLRNWSRIRFHLGTNETLGRLVLLDREELKPGQETYAHIVLETPIVCCKGDPFVIRFYSPPATIGGGRVIEEYASRAKRYNSELINHLKIKERGSLEDLILQQIELYPQNILTIEELANKTGAAKEEIVEKISLLIKRQKAVEIKRGEYISKVGLDSIISTITAQLEKYHREFPLRQGYPREDIRSRFFSWLNVKEFNSILQYIEENQGLVCINNHLKLVTHSPLPGTQELQLLTKIMEKFNENMFSPPTLEEIKKDLAVEDDLFEELIYYLTDQGCLIRVKQEVWFSTQAVEEARKRLDNYFEKEQELSLGTARDLFDTSRKYALPLMEYFDRTRFTRRVGDLRVRSN